jgi:uncharacterized membrane protein YeaQ/YmgE (transglycosylase-associated protein family)
MSFKTLIIVIVTGALAIQLDLFINGSSSLHPIFILWIILLFVGSYMLTVLKIDVGVDSPFLSQTITAAIGAAAGWLASFVMGGGGLIRYLITGIIGSFVGSYLLSALKIDLGIGNPLMSQILTATIGAIVVVFLARLIA